MKYLVHALLFLLCAALLYLLHRYGIATFLTTLLVYYFVYLGLKALLGLIPSPRWRELLQGNLRALALLLLGLEFAMTFILGLMNTPMEKKRFLYLSEYLRAEQSALLLRLGVDDARFVFTDLYAPNSRREIEKGDYRYTHTYNALGTRGPLPPKAKAPGEFRVVLLGDSFAEGEGAPDDSTIAVRLQHYLMQQHPGRTISVINGGIAGSSPVYEQELFRRHLQAYRPDLVVQAYYANDLFDLNVMRHSDKLPRMEYAWALSHIYRILYIQFINPDYVQFGYSELPAAENRVFLENMLQQRTDSFRTALAGQGTQLLTVYIPSKDELIDDDIEFTAQQTETNWSKDCDLNLYTELPETVRPKLSSRELVALFYWGNDAHLNPKGYDKTAQLIASRISLPPLPTAGPAPADSARRPSDGRYPVRFPGSPR